jgi:hypothetical protein
MRGRPWPDKALSGLHRVGDVDEPGWSVSIVTTSKWSSAIRVLLTGGNNARAGGGFPARP